MLTLADDDRVLRISLHAPLLGKSFEMLWRQAPQPGTVIKRPCHRSTPWPFIVCTAKFCADNPTAARQGTLDAFPSNPAVSRRAVILHTTTASNVRDQSA